MKNKFLFVLACTLMPVSLYAEIPAIEDVRVDDLSGFKEHILKIEQQLDLLTKKVDKYSQSQSKSLETCNTEIKNVAALEQQIMNQLQEVLNQQQELLYAVTLLYNRQEALHLEEQSKA